MLRFAPSPTKDMNISDLRIALINHIFSKQLNEELIIRIEDTDTKKNIEGKDKEILELLNLFSIDYTRVIHQSDNIKYHTQMAMKLLLDKKAFNCFCSKEALELDRKENLKSKKPYRYSGFCENISDEAKFQCNAPFVVRLRKPNKNIIFTDILKGNFNYSAFDIDSFIILRQNKTPMYNFACSVDDMIHNISTVIRDEKHLSNTPKQIHIRDSLSYDKQINYIHLPSILNLNTGKKLNNNDNFSSVKNLVQEGYLPAAIANYLILLGYNPPNEIFTIEECIQWFDIKKVSKSSAKFDINKLKFINREHLKNMDEMRLSKILGFADIDIGKLAKIYINECDTTNQIKNKINLIFSKKDNFITFQEEYLILKKCLLSAPFIDDFDAFIIYITKHTKLNNKSLFLPLRYILTGVTNGPSLSKIYPLIKNYLGEIL